MTEQEIKGIVNTLRQMNKREAMFNTAASVEFTRLYEKLFPGESLCSTCTNKIGAAYDKIVALSPDKISILSQQNKYSFRNPDDLIDLSFHPVAGVPVHLTKGNLTDSIAEKLLTKNEKFKSRFIIKTDTEAAKKSTKRKEKTNTQIADEDKNDVQQQIETLDKDLSKTDIIKKLQMKNISFNSDASKIELIKQLIKSP
jgi:hypothetical protein